MIWLIVISILIIAAYTTAVCIKQKGIPYSISATFYAIEHKGWFRFTMWACPMVLMPAILEVSKPGTEWLAFLACAGMFFIGVAPNFKDSFEGSIHEIGAILCLVGSQAWVAGNCPWCLMVWIAYVGYTVAIMVRNENDSIISDFLHTKPMFWIEVTALTSTYLSLLILA